MASASQRNNLASGNSFCPVQRQLWEGPHFEWDCINIYNCKHLRKPYSQCQHHEDGQRETLDFFILLNVMTLNIHHFLILNIYLALYFLLRTVG